MCFEWGSGIEVRREESCTGRDFWLKDWEKQAIIAFHLKNPPEGYRRLTFMMLDADIVAVSPASVWRVLSRAGLLRKWNAKPSKKGTGFEQPPQPHQHWHIDVCLPECLRDVLLSVQHPGRLQPFPGSL
jgi:putative transposase